jgi:hypothetical protein
VIAQPVSTTALVLKVVDGDTIDIRDDVRGRLRIRLLGTLPLPPILDAQRRVALRAHADPDHASPPDPIALEG